MYALQEISPPTLLICGCIYVSSKFDGGKQINRSQSRSWEGDVPEQDCGKYLGLHGNPRHGRRPQGLKQTWCSSPPLRKKEKQVTTERKRKAGESVKEMRRQRQYKKTDDNSQQVRRDYSRHDSGRGVMDTVSDVPQDYLEKMMLDYYKTNTAITDRKVLEVERVTRGQGTALLEISGWHIIQYRRDSKTEVYNKGSQFGEEQEPILYSTFRGTAATEWGKLQEPETSQAYLDTKRPSS